MLGGSGTYMLHPLENSENVVQFGAFWCLEKFPKN